MSSRITKSIITFKLQLAVPVRTTQTKVIDQPSLLVPPIADHSATSVNVCFPLKPAGASSCNSSKTISVPAVGCKVKYEHKLFSISTASFPLWTLILKLCVGSFSQ